MDVLPKLRPIEAFPVEVDGQSLVCLRDPLRYAEQPLLVPHAALFVLTLLDGRRSTIDVQEEVARRFGTLLDGAQLRTLLQTLDAHHYLDSAGFAARRAAVDAAFRGASLRAAAHADASYPAEPAALRAHLDGFFAELAPLAGVRGELRALIAPHIDLRVGGTAYGHAYRAVAAHARATRFVILGTSHCGGASLFAATRKDFATPFGPVPSDRAFLDRLAAHYPADLFADETLHRTEHAVEFQVVMLQHVLGGRRPFTIVPLLVSSFHEMIAARRAPGEDPRVASMVAALRAALAADDVPTVLIAGVDFAHVGEKFGDREGLDPALLERAEAKDRRLVAALEAADPARFFAEIAADGDRTRVCGFAPMMTLLLLLDGMPGRLLHYERSRDEATRSSVSYASLIYCAPGA